MHVPPVLLSLLQLDVKGCKDIYESFLKYCEEEVMDGPNQYKAEGHGLQVGRTCGGWGCSQAG